MFALLVSAAALIGVVASQATPAPTFTGHEQLFEKIRFEENKTRYDTWDHAADFGTVRITEWADTLVRVFCEHRDALIKWDVNGSTGQPRLVVQAGSQLAFLDPISGDVQPILDSVLVAKDWSVTDVAWNNTHNASDPMQQYNLSETMISNVRPNTHPLLDDEDGKVALAQLEAFFPSYYRQVVADLFSFINAPGTVSDADPAIYRARFIARLEADLFNFNLTKGSITGTCTTGADADFLNDTDAAAYDVDRGRMWYTTRLQNTADDHIGNSCQLRYLDVDTCTQTAAANYEGHFEERHFVNVGTPAFDEQAAYRDEICKLPGLAWAPKPDPRLFAVTYYCDIIVFNSSETNADPALGVADVVGTSTTLRALVNESDANSGFPDDWRCERSGLAYDCLNNILYLIVQPTDDYPVVLVSLNPQTGAILDMVNTSVAAYVGDLYGIVPDELEPRVGYGLTSTDCYRMNFVMDAMDFDFNLTRKSLWMHGNATAQLLEDGLALIENATIFWGNETIEAIYWDGNETRLAIDGHMEPLVDFLNRTSTVINSTSTLIDFLHDVLTNSTANITALGPQVQTWIDAFSIGSNDLESIAYEALKDARETLIERIDRIRDELEHRHTAIVGVADEIEMQVVYNGARIDNQLRRLMTAYSDHERWEDDDDDDNGLGSSDYSPSLDI